MQMSSKGCSGCSELTPLLDTHAFLRVAHGGRFSTVTPEIVSKSASFRDHDGMGQGSVDRADRDIDLLNDPIRTPQFREATPVGAAALRYGQTIKRDKCAASAARSGSDSRSLCPSS